MMKPQDSHERLKRLGWYLIGLALFSSAIAYFKPEWLHLRPYDSFSVYMLSTVFLAMAFFALSASWYAKFFPKRPK